ncbi:tetratricopeptide repeat protein [Roseovarius sp. E0-M6]|uniref:tetratricopeptide repeat protein n=1 Tax=Roseovarius sp. E0-M6 TaxID=3127118 RepID=UPI003010603B
MRYLVRFALILVMLGPVAADAQSRDETLADIRQELTVLYVDIQKLKRELSTTGGVSGANSGGTLIDRVNAIESELQRLTAKTEELELRINRVVQDGTKRIGDLEFRLVELEGGDVSQLGEVSTLGGDIPGGSEAAVADPEGSTTEDETQGMTLAVGEQDDFDRAKAAFEAGNHAEAAKLFAEFRNAYPGGPMTDRAGVLQGESLEATGDLTGAARAYLDTFSAAPEGDEAPNALFRLGRTLGRLGQTNEACLTLAEVPARFPGSEAVSEADSAMTNLGCQ